jgi:hypothetical protein
MVKLTLLSLTFLIGCSWVPNSAVIIDEKSQSKSIDDGFDFELSETVSPGEEAAIRWEKVQNLSSITVLVYRILPDRSSELVVKLSGIESESISVEIAESGEYQVQLQAHLKNGRIVHSVLKSLSAQYPDSLTPILVYDPHTLVVGEATQILPKILALQGKEVKACTAKTALPSWANLNATTCVISGTPTSVLTSSEFIIQVENKVNLSTEAILRFEVRTNRTLSVNFMNQSLVSDIGPNLSFTRASEATFFSSQGLLQSASSGMPRFEHVFSDSQWISKGLIINPLRNNTAFDGSDMSSNTYWGYSYGISRTPGFGNPFHTSYPLTKVVPDGTSNAKLLGTTLGGIRGSCITGPGCRFRVLVKSVGIPKITLGRAGGSGPFYGGTDFSFTQEAFTNLRSLDSSATVTEPIFTKLAGDYYLFDFGFKKFTTGGFVTGIVLWPQENNYAVAGDSDSYILAGMWQTYSNEDRPIPRSLIPTTNAAVTHQADILKLDGADFNNLYNPEKGSFEFSFEPLGFGGVQGVFSLNDATDQNRMELNLEDDELKFIAVKNGTTLASQTLQSLTRNQVTKVKFAYSGSQFAVSLDDGVPTLINGTFDLPSVNSLYIGNNAQGDVISAHYRDLHYVPRYPPSILSWWW